MPKAVAAITLIRQLILTNLTLGFLVTVVSLLESTACFQWR